MDTWDGLTLSEGRCVGGLGEGIEQKNPTYTSHIGTDYSVVIA